MPANKHRYNPTQKGKAFNEDIQPPAQFTDITPEDRQESEDRTAALIEKARADMEEHGHS